MQALAAASCSFRPQNKTLFVFERSLFNSSLNGIAAYNIPVSFVCTRTRVYQSNCSELSTQFRNQQCWNRIRYSNKKSLINHWVCHRSNTWWIDGNGGASWVQRIRMLICRRDWDSFCSQWIHLVECYLLRTIYSKINLVCLISPNPHLRLLRITFGSEICFMMRMSEPFYQLTVFLFGPIH